MALVIARKRGEQVKIFDPNDGTFEPIILTATSKRTSFVIEAPRHLKVMRAELLDRPAGIPVVSSSPVMG
jgi:sRNA-binding carbon storage regulator CsrA